ncbi:MAG TPA: 50S ribosomal protein L17 [Spirochaetota bacterium]|nr:50S ribosomal protein L17 [Spirochaetota bacterium]
MNHLKGFRTLNRTHSHRRALYKNMVTALFRKERIKTTLIKAKEIRSVAEKIITKAKVKSLHNIRIVSRLITDKDILKKLFDEIAPRYVERAGGYTRILKLAKRKGDGADMAYIELVAEVVAGKKKKKKATDKKEVKKETNVKEKKDEKKSLENNLVVDKKENSEEVVDNKKEQPKDESKKEE